jgi:hypothetical protein
MNIVLVPESRSSPVVTPSRHDGTNALNYVLFLGSLVSNPIVDRGAERADRVVRTGEKALSGALVLVACSA